MFKPVQVAAANVERAERKNNDGVSMRLFYAIEFDEKTKALLLKEQIKLKPKALRANMTQKENLHLTLRYIGEVNNVYIPVLEKIQTAAASKSSPFQLILSEPGTFTRGHKSIIWWGVRHDAHLDELYKNLEELIRKNGFPAEHRPYMPHITLAREFTARENTKSIIKSFEPINHIFTVNSISLMESKRVNGKLRYICLYNTALKRNETV